MSEEKGARGQEAQGQPQEDEDLIAGEVRVASGASPRILRWAGYLLYLWAAAYLVVHPPIEHRAIILLFASIIGAWLFFYALTKRPPEP